MTKHMEQKTSQQNFEYILKWIESCKHEEQLGRCLDCISMYLELERITLMDAMKLQGAYALKKLQLPISETHFNPNDYEQTK